MENEECRMQNSGEAMIPPNWPEFLDLHFRNSAFYTLHLGNWSARQDLHLRSLGPRPSALAATLRAVGPGAFTTPGAGEMQDTNPDNGPAVRLEIGGPEGSCTLNPPADNGALC